MEQEEGANPQYVSISAPIPISSSNVCFFTRSTLIDLPPEVWSIIFSFFEMKDLLHGIGRVSDSWRQLALDGVTRFKMPRKADLGRELQKIFEFAEKSFPRLKILDFSFRPIVFVAEQEITRLEEVRKVRKQWKRAKRQERQYWYKLYHLGAIEDVDDRMRWEDQALEQYISERKQEDTSDLLVRRRFKQSLPRSITGLDFSFCPISGADLRYILAPDGTEQEDEPTARCAPIYR